MNVLDAIPGIGQILDDLITSKEELEEVKLRLREVEFRSEVERAKTLRSMLSNQSLFVSGGIPAFLWIGVIVLLNNHVIAPYFSAVKPMDLPEAYWGLLSTIIIGLFGKKVIDDNQWSWNGKVISPSKKQVDMAVEEGRIEPLPVEVSPLPSRARPSAVVPSSVSKEDPDYTNRRFEELVAQYGGEQQKGGE